MTDFSAQYDDKRMAMADIASLVHSGDRIAANFAASIPPDLLNALCERTDLEDVEVFACFIMRQFPFLVDPEVAKRVHYNSYFMGPLERKLYPQGLFSQSSVSFSKMKQYYTDVARPDVFITSAAPMDEDGYLSLGPMGVAVGSICADLAKTVLVQVSKGVPAVTGPGTRLHISQVTALVEQDFDMPELGEAPVAEIDKVIASLIVPRIGDGSTIQVGFGGLSNAVAYGLEGKRDLSVHTEMITESMMHLARAGVINGSIRAGFALGSAELYKFAGESPQVHLEPLDVVNDAHVIAQNKDFVSINSCLMVDLHGQVVSEGVGTRMLSSTGGASDFVRGATASEGGQSYICVASTRKDPVTGELTSNIVPALPAGSPVTIQRSDVQNIVTEYGIADLYNRSFRERAEALIAIAHPDFRDELTAAAATAGLLN